MEEKELLVIVAHTDDETLMCGGTIHKWPGEKNVMVVNPGGMLGRRNKQPVDDLVEYNRKTMDACGKACELLNVDNLIFGSFQGDCLSSNRFDHLDITHEIGRFIEYHNPDVIITHSLQDTDFDHRRVAEAVIAETRPYVRRVQVLLGEVLGVTDPNRGWAPNTYSWLDGSNAQAKLDALTYYDTETNLHKPRSIQAIDALMKVRGAESGSIFAEAFTTWRAFI